MTNLPLQVFDSSRRAIRIGNQLGRGGEGAVYEVDANNVAKIYHKPISSEKAAKITAMVALRSDQLSRLAAWPSGLLFDQSGAPTGLLMPKISGRKDIHVLYSPKSRRADFQRADWRFLIRVALNTATAFSAVHAAGCVIGDVNHGGVLVAQDATVRLIDCDSFQVTSGTRRFLCEVGVETFTPPELQGREFKGIVRTPNHDNFGLAVLIFQLLFMGRHPFAGRFLGSGEMPIAKAIQESRFAYGVRRNNLNMERPPGTPPLGLVGDEVGMAFELAFGAAQAAGGRPSATEWVGSLRQLEAEVRQCSKAANHWYHRGSSACPWCAMESATGVSLFPIVIQQDHGGPGLDVDQLWRHVNSLAPLGPAPTISVPLPSPSAEAQAMKGRKHRKTVFAAGLAFALVVVGFATMEAGAGPIFFIAAIGAFFGIKAIPDSKAGIDELKNRFEAAQRVWNAADAEWSQRAGEGEFYRLKGELTQLRARYEDIPRRRQAKLDQLKQHQQSRQLEEFLDRFEVVDADIKGIGPGRKQTLVSFGIETAWDVTPQKLAPVPGFGPKTIALLTTWRRGHESKFRFDPTKGANPQDIAAIDYQAVVERRDVETKLRSVAAELSRAHGNVVEYRKGNRARVDDAFRAYQQLKADYDFVRVR